MVIDANVWVSLRLIQDVHHQRASTWMRSEASAAAVAIPVSCLAEVAGAVARRTGSPSQGRLVAGYVRRTPSMRLVELDLALGDAAAELAANLRIRGADALYVAVAARLGMPLVTFDQELASRAAEAVEVIRPS